MVGKQKINGIDTVYRTGCHNIRNKSSDTKVVDRMNQKGTVLIY